MTDQQRIRELKENLTRSIRQKDVAGAIAPFAERTVLFVLPPPLRVIAGENAPDANGIADWFSSFADDIGLDYQELTITASSEVAFCHSLEHLTGSRSDGTATDLWFRETLGLQKVQGEWKITHQHQSVPLYMDKQGQAATDLKPQGPSL